MDINEAKNIVIEAGKLLLETGLIARTWGNISCRISDTQFVITPSGRAYDSLTPDEIVAVNISDTSYSGDVKPSSEKGIHASCYRLRPEVNFVIHTHQTNASVLSVLREEIAVKGDEFISILGSRIPCAVYGLPGTKKLCKGVCAAIVSCDSNAVIMAHHGALCMGKDFGDAFKVAVNLEKVCGNNLLGESTFKSCTYSGYCAETKRSTGGFDTIATKGKDGVERENGIHKAIYAARPDINHIIHDTDCYAVSCSGGKKALKPMLDDFAQLIGRNLKVSKDCDRDISRKVKGRNAVLVKDKGAYCFAVTDFDAQAVEMIVNKGCKTQKEASLLGTPKAINPLECVIMRLVYLKKYSKQISKKPLI